TAQKERTLAESLLVYKDQSPSVLAKALSDREVALAAVKRENSELVSNLHKQKAVRKKLTLERNELANDMKLLLACDKNRLPVL
ncbi:hypothetical protein Ciccas_009403, partial [Cichlidogyrus casuarinus]